MYRITIETLQRDLLTAEAAEMANSPFVERAISVYNQTFDELDVAALITAINKKPRTRGPRKKKGEAK